MPSQVTGDYSRYPEVIRDSFPLIAGEVCELRQAWEVYHRLFMDDRGRTELLAKELGPLLGILQNLLQDELFLAIGRLTDKSNRQPNLSLKLLKTAIPFATASDFSQKVESALAAIEHDASDIIFHRHKRLAHFDLNVSLNASLLPEVTFLRLRQLIERIEDFLNLFYWEFEKTTMFFFLPGVDITGRAESCAYKSKAYDVLEDQGVIEHGTWRDLLRNQRSRPRC